MSYKTLMVGIAAFALAMPAAGQNRGTMEFGAFGSVASFDKQLSLTEAYGGGGRAAMYLDPRWAIEFEMAEMRAGRPNGLRDVNVGILASRLLFIPLKQSRSSFLLGVGAGNSTETNFLHTYGVGALVGVKMAINNSISLRLDGTMDWLANENWKKHQSVRLGLSMYRHTQTGTRMVGVPMQAETLVLRSEDSVGTREMARLRRTEADYRALRDSLRNNRGPVQVFTSAATLATMEAPIHFEFNKFDISNEAKAALDAKIAVARSNPSMTIIMLGYTDVVGTDAYNMALGTRRAQAAKEYIVSQGIATNRVIIETRGERMQTPNSAGEAGEAENRRAIFRLLIAPTVIRPQ
jgi:outer membrane protein OmpA-like peptidoglycan-associated protein